MKNITKITLAAIAAISLAASTAAAGDGTSFVSAGNAGRVSFDTPAQHRATIGVYVDGRTVGGERAAAAQHLPFGNGMAWISTGNGGLVQVDLAGQ